MQGRDVTGCDDNSEKGGSLPERRAWAILSEMGLPFERNVMINTPFRDWPVEADVIVDKCLIIEVQGLYFHGKATRHRKDHAKAESFEAMGYGVLWLYDDELKLAFQKAKGPVWKAAIKDWITKMMEYSRNVRELYLRYRSGAACTPSAEHPEFKRVNLHTDSRRD